MSDSQSGQPTDLSGYMQSTTYQQFDPGTGAVIPDGQNAGGQNPQTQGVVGNPAEGASPAIGADGNATQAVPSAQSVTTPGPSEAEQRAAYFEEQSRLLNERLMQATTVLQQQAQVSEQREREAFEQSLKDLPEAEANYRRAERDIAALRQQNQYLQNQALTAAQQQNAAQQHAAKAAVADRVAQETGIPGFGDALMGAVNFEHMQAIAQNLAARLGATQQQVQQPQQQQYFSDPNAVNVAGGAGPTSTPTPQPVPGSGDLLTFLKSRPYKQVPATE